MPTLLAPLDVSDLAPPEPLERILVTLRNLGPDEVLKVHHRREPRPLFPLLLENGFHYLCRQQGEAAFRIYIWHADSGDLTAFCLADLRAEAIP
ncbi:DUF2249 domain-containing protein [Motiliproteus sp. SC1-56]|uniref:DUF2249 domain-containing protein n=1 Tax=Motiliproteus sp. SC1-56 TaxID=2799565 RepID=UPI001A906446|nr:DUF2249 domain-containing protein [Motiliproteus sp. SC1-56]